jgi:hypothetical protein
MKRGLVIVSLGYWLSRLVFYLLGIRFLGLHNLYTYLQIIDPPLLEHHLLSSLYYTSFPPLYNVVIGVMLKLFGPSATAFAVLHLFVGWALALVLFSLMTDLGVGWRLAAGATVLFMILPPTILYENWLFYTYIETLLFTLSAWSFLRFVRQPALGWGLALFSSYTALALLNARMLYFILIIALFLWWQWRQRPPVPGLRRTLALSLSPVLLVVLFMAKNAWLFGEFTMDPHFGFHVGNGFIYEAWSDPETHAVCLQDYPILLIPPMEFPSAQKAGLPPPPITGVPLLDDTYRSGGQPNYNTLYFIEVAQQYTQAITDFVVHHPRLYLRFVGSALVNFWKPSSYYIFFPMQNRDILGRYDAAYSLAYPLLLALYAVGVAYALYAGWRQRWRTPLSATLGLMVAIAGYTMLAIFVTLGENDRYKFTIEPLLWAFVVYALCHTPLFTRSEPNLAKN